MGSERTYGVNLTLDQIKAVRMAIRWGVPSPCPPDVMEAQKALGDTQLRAEEIEAGESAGV